MLAFHFEELGQLGEGQFSIRNLTEQSLLGRGKWINEGLVRMNNNWHTEGRETRGREKATYDYIDYAGIGGTTRCSSFSEAPAAGWIVALSDGPRYTPAPFDTSYSLLSRRMLPFPSIR